MSAAGPQLSPDGRFYWDGERWLPMAAAPSDPPSAIQPKRGGLGGYLVLVVVLIVVFSSVYSSLAKFTPGQPASSPSTWTRAPFDPAAYKASATVVPYKQLVKDPAAMKGTVVAYRAKVFQYDSRTTTEHMLVKVTPDDYGIWSDMVWLDLPGGLALNSIVQDDIVEVWGAVVGPYTYSTTFLGSNTVPEISVRIIDKQPL